MFYSNCSIWRIEEKVRVETRLRYDYNLSLPNRIYNSNRRTRRDIVRQRGNINGMWEIRSRFARRLFDLLIDSGFRYQRRLLNDVKRESGLSKSVATPKSLAVLRNLGNETGTKRRVQTRWLPRLQDRTGSLRDARWSSDDNTKVNKLRLIFKSGLRSRRVALRRVTTRLLRIARTIWSTEDSNAKHEKP